MKVVLRYLSTGKTRERQNPMSVTALWCDGIIANGPSGEQSPEVELPFSLLSPQRRSKEGSNGKRVTILVTGNESAKGKNAEGENPKGVVV